jgi:FkbM family methyltransferase
MSEIKKEDFTAPNGSIRTFYYHDLSNDRNTIIACFANDEYKILELYRDEQAFIDIGAHLGSVSMLASTLNPQPKIIAVEPLPENVDLIKMNAKENGIDLTIYPIAIHPKSGEKTKVYYGGGEHDFVGQENLTNSREFSAIRRCVEVDTISIEDIIKNNKIDSCIIKIDAEGIEEELFKHMTNETLSKIKVLVGEYHNADAPGFFPFGDQYELNWKGIEFYFKRK